MKIRVLKFKKVSGIEYKVGREYDAAKDVAEQLIKEGCAVLLENPKRKSLKIELENKAIEKVGEDKGASKKKDEVIKKKKITKRKTKK